MSFNKNIEEFHNIQKKQPNLIESIPTITSTHTTPINEPGGNEPHTSPIVSNANTPRRNSFVPGATTINHKYSIVPGMSVSNSICQCKRANKTNTTNSYSHIYRKEDIHPGIIDISEDIKKIILSFGKKSSDKNSIYADIYDFFSPLIASRNNIKNMINTSLTKCKETVMKYDEILKAFNAFSKNVIYNRCTRETTFTTTITTTYSSVFDELGEFILLLNDLKSSIRAIIRTDNSKIAKIDKDIEAIIVNIKTIKDKLQQFFKQYHS